MNLREKALGLAGVTHGGCPEGPDCRACARNVARIEAVLDEVADAARAEGHRDGMADAVRMQREAWDNGYADGVRRELDAIDDLLSQKESMLWAGLLPDEAAVITDVRACIRARGHRGT